MGFRASHLLDPDARLHEDLRFAFSSVWGRGWTAAVGNPGSVSEATFGSEFSVDTLLCPLEAFDKLGPPRLGSWPHPMRGFLTRTPKDRCSGVLWTRYGALLATLTDT